LYAGDFRHEWRIEKQAARKSGLSTAKIPTKYLFHSKDCLNSDTKMPGIPGGMQ
jgi:hypothetical protein